MPASALSLESRVTRLEHDSSQVLSLLLETRHDMADGFARLEAKFDRLDARFDGLDAKVDALDARVNSLDAKVDVLDAKVDHGFAIQHADILALENRQNVHEAISERNVENLLGLLKHPNDESSL